MKKVLAIVLSVAMLLSVLSVNVFAEELSCSAIRWRRFLERRMGTMERERGKIYVCPQ